MDRLKPQLDAADRKVLGQALVLVLLFFLVVLVLAAGAGAAVRVFMLAAGW